MSELLETCSQEPNEDRSIGGFCAEMPTSKEPKDGGCRYLSCSKCMFYSNNESEFLEWNVINTDTAEEVPGGSCPSQYALPEGASELQDLIEHREMNFSIGNIFKACYRMNDCAHSDAERNLNKILWFAQRELDRTSGVPKEG